MTGQDIETQSCEVLRAAVKCMLHAIRQCARAGQACRPALSTSGLDSSALSCQADKPILNVFPQILQHTWRTYIYLCNPISLVMIEVGITSRCHLHWHMQINTCNTPTHQHPCINSAYVFPVHHIPALPPTTPASTLHELIHPHHPTHP